MQFIPTTSAQAELDYSMDDVFHLLTDATSRPDWDPVMAEYKVVRTLAEGPTTAGDLTIDLIDLTYTATNSMVGGLISA
ncbi:hypothetical protein HK101_001363, partial [Irineochytrium annulatum]